MYSRKIACVATTVLIGAIGVPAAASTQPSQKTYVVEAPKLEPSLVRQVSYADLNLANRPDRSVLRGRIVVAANDICRSVNEDESGIQACNRFAVSGTRGQVRAAIRRAQMQLAGLAVGPAVAVSLVVSAQ